MLRDEIAKIMKQEFWSTPDHRDFREYPVADQILALIEGERCVWTVDDSYIEYTTTCGRTLDTPQRINGTYCPYCGKHRKLK